MFLKSFKNNKDKYSYKDYTSDIIKMLELFNSANTKITFKELMSVLKHISENIEKITFKKNSINSFHEGQRLQSILTNISYTSYIETWLKTFGIAGLKDLREVNDFSYKINNEIIYITKNIVSMSIIRFNKIKDSKDSKYIKMSKLKKIRHQNTYKRKINRIDDI